VGASGESSAAALGKLFLAWLDPGADGQQNTNDDRWLNAVDGNFTVGSTVVTNYQNDFDGAGGNDPGSWDNFALQFGVNNANVANFLGSWGVDATNWTDPETGVSYGGRVWAVVDHNSDFSVVPEP